MSPCVCRHGGVSGCMRTETVCFTCVTCELLAKNALSVEGPAGVRKEQRSEIKEEWKEGGNQGVRGPAVGD